MRKKQKPKAIIITPVSDILWSALEKEKKRVQENNKMRKIVSVPERLDNIVKCCGE